MGQKHWKWQLSQLCHKASPQFFGFLSFLQRTCIAFLIGLINVEMKRAEQSHCPRSMMQKMLSEAVDIPRRHFMYSHYLHL